MKVLYRISLFFSVGCITFFLGIFANQFYTSRIENSLQKEKSYENYGKDISEAEVESSLKQEKNTVEVSAKKESLVDCDTIYMIEAYDTDTKKEEEIKEELPAKYIGMDRETLENEIAEYSAAPTLRDQEKGFVSANLVSFSGEKIVVRKNYYIPEPKCYYLAVDNNYVIVYESDLTTVYTTTDILLENLPKDLQNEIISMKYMGSEEDVYHFLESHSS